MKTKPEKIGTIPNGNALWDEYQLKKEMYDHYENKVSRTDGSRQERATQRLEQYKMELALVEGKLMDFCKKHNLSY